MSFMEPSLLRTTVVGSYPFPSWLHHAVDHWNVFGSADQQEIIEDAVTVAIMDQIGAGLDVITDGEQTRLDFNLSFYGFLEGISLESASPRRWGPQTSRPTWSACNRGSTCSAKGTWHG